VLEKEDKYFVEAGITNPWDTFQEPLERNFVWACYKRDKQTCMFKTDDKNGATLGKHFFGNQK
jgi:hypothetical protein